MTGFIPRTDWVDTPSTATPIMAADLLRIEAALATAAPDTTTHLPPAAVMTALDSTYGKRTSIVRANPQLMPTFTRKRALTRLNQAPTRILCVGDSTTAGIYSDSYTTATGSTNQGGPNSWPAQLASRLNASGLPSEYSLCLPGHSGNDDSRWNITGGFSYAAFGAGRNASYTGSGAQTMTLTPGVSASAYTVYFYGDSGTGAFSVTATGGTATAVNTVNSTAGVYSASVTAGSASASNVLSFSVTSGQVFILGVESFTTGTANKVRVMNAGVGGSKATDWNDASNPGALNFIKAVAPDLTIISLGVNDGGAGTAAATVLAAVEGVASAAAVSGDVILMSAIPHNGAGILDQYNALYLTSAHPYVDLQFRYGYSMEAMGLQTTDYTHPNALGYGDIATAVAQILAA